MSTPTPKCHQQENHYHHPTLVNRLWDRMTQAVHNPKITQDAAIKQALLKEQQTLELQNLARRSVDIHRMIMQQIL